MFTSAATWLVASAVSRYRIDWFIPAMFLVIGGRHLTFATWFGWRVDWVCGAALALAGYALIRYSASPQMGAFAGAVIECAFAVHLLTAVRKEEAH